MIPFGRARNGEHELPHARSRAERLRVWQGWIQILLALTTIALLFLRT